MRNNQPNIPGLEPGQPNLEEVFRPLIEKLAYLEDRVKQLELEVSLLRIMIEKN